MTHLPSFIRFTLARWRFRKEFAHIDKAISEARRAHKPVRHLLKAKAAVLHHALAGVR